MNKAICLSLALTLLTGCTNSAGSVGASSAVSGVSGSGSDLYYEYTVSGSGKAIRMNGFTKMYMAGSGAVRVEMLLGIDTNGAKASTPSIVLLGDSHTPTETIELDDAAKTFTRNHIDTAAMGVSRMRSNSVVTRIGDETWLGFHCVHARIISTIKMGGFFSIVDTVDIWKSNDVPMQPGFRHWMEKFQARENASAFSPEVAEKLKQMGCEGLFVRLESRGKDSHTVTALSKVERRDLPAGMFKVPEGYREEKAN
ncbi:MAG TPA: DUF4412 domain-containing protein [Dinghuibacter sp.]|uniref:DUF4412 domain-containing protein n=1 Tax=Dinghuibacter sp. TaxID=2024697 RepID=UPI002BEE1FC1|nr:DUF4412 domain-containing protein [Dinghuibacter sp.]HTJ10492.1 DUF4412 domain-containing protein [Dinghuibacter sp.]